MRNASGDRFRAGVVAAIDDNGRPVVVLRGSTRHQLFREVRRRSSKEVKKAPFQAPFDRDGLAPQKSIIDGIDEKIKSGNKLTRTEKQTLRDTAKQTIDIAQAMEREDVETLSMAELRAQLYEVNKNVTLTYQGVTGTIKEERG